MNGHPREQIELEREPDGLPPSERAALRIHLASCAECRAYAVELARNDELLSRRERVTQMPPIWLRRRGSALPGVLAAAAIVVFVVVTAIGVARENASRPPLVLGSPSATVVGSATPVGTNGSPLPSPTPSPSVSPIATASNGLGALTGQWIFVGKFVQPVNASRGRVEIWGIPLRGGPARLAYTYDVSIGGAPEGALDNTPYLRRQFSPDGRQLALSIDGELVVVELETGRVRRLGVSGSFPSWSKDGALIAFAHESPAAEVVPPPMQLAVVAPTGGATRDLGVTVQPRQSAEWSPDGLSLLVPTADGLALVDVTSARVLRSFGRLGVGSPSLAHWRGSGPQIALVDNGCGQGTARLLVSNDAAAPTRTVVDSGTSCEQVLLRDPRWNPSTSSEILYVGARQSPGAEPSDYVVHLVNVGTGTDRSLGLRAYEATWTWTDGQIAYIEKSDNAPFGAAVIVAAAADPTTQRQLLRAESGARFFSIAVVGY